MTKKLKNLKSSLDKKERLIDDKIRDHMDGVLETQWQPLQDGGRSSKILSSREKEDNSIRKLKESIESTQYAIAVEEERISETQKMFDSLPKALQDRILSGELTQWRKYPRIMFVNGVDKARINWDAKKGVVVPKFHNRLEGEDRKRFVAVFNAIVKELRGQ